MNTIFDNERTAFKIISFSTVLVCILSLTFISYPEYWKNIIYEKSPMTWFESMILFACTFISMLNFILLKAKTGQFNKVWFLFVMGFLYLTIDERFMVHEKIREQILKPNHLNIDFLFWVEKGDYVLIFLMVTGLFFVPMIWKELKSDKEATLFFLIAIFCSAVAVGLDTISLKGMSLQLQYVIQYFEEIAETAAMVCFLNAIMMKFFENLACFCRVEEIKSMVTE
jgi:hypothetical protein